jgi:hypothetical protein
MGCCGNRDDNIDEDLYGTSTVEQLIDSTNEQLQKLKLEKREITSFLSNKNEVINFEINNRSDINLIIRKKNVNDLITTLEYAVNNLKKYENQINFNQVFPMINDLFYVIKSKHDPSEGIKFFYNEFNNYITSLI